MPALRSLPIVEVQAEAPRRTRLPDGRPYCSRVSARGTQQRDTLDRDPTHAIRAARRQPHQSIEADHRSEATRPLPSLKSSMRTRALRLHLERAVSSKEEHELPTDHSALRSWASPPGLPGSSTRGGFRHSESLGQAPGSRAWGHESTFQETFQAGAAVEESGSCPFLEVVRVPYARLAGLQ
jgi:hypothetical protein